MSGGDRAAAMEAQGNSIIRRVPDRLMPGSVSSQLQPDKSGQLLHKVCLAARSARRAAPLSAHVHALCRQRRLQFVNRNFSKVENGCGKARVDVRDFSEQVDEILDAPCPAGGDDRH